MRRHLGDDRSSVNTQDTLLLPPAYSVLVQRRGVALGQGTGLQREADIDVSICLRCCQGDAQRADSPPPMTLGWVSTGLSLTISKKEAVTLHVESR